MIPLAKRTQGLIQSEIRAVSQMVDAVGGINLGQGICDLPTPPTIKSAAAAAIAENRSTYSSYAGTPDLRAFILEKVREYNKIPAASEAEIVVSVGSTGAFAVTMWSILDPGDRVLMFEPFYGYHVNLVRAVGGVVDTVRQRFPAWTIDFDELEAAVTPRTRAIVVTTPANPHGKVWTSAELTTLLEVAERHNLLIVTDEIYEYMTYDDQVHVSLASLEGAYDRTVTISGFSKTFNMTGWRLGYAVAKPPIIEKMGLLNDVFHICAPTPLQHGVAAARELSPAFYQRLRDDYTARRQLMCETLEQIDFSVPWPQGAYYVLAGFERLTDGREGFADDQAACRTLIERCGIGTVAGSAFYHDPTDGRHQLRFCFAKEMAVLEEACERLRRGLAA